MKVRILLNLPKTIDGKPVGPFSQGQVCDLDDDTAQTFIASAMAAEYVDEPVEEPEPPAVVQEAVPETGVAEAERAAAEGEARRARRSAE